MFYYPCPKCDVVFNKKSNLTRHLNKIFDCSKKVNMKNNLQKLTKINKNSQKLTKINKNLENSESLENLENLESLTAKNFEQNNNNKILYKELIKSQDILKSDFDNLTKINNFLNINESTFCCSYCNKKLVNKYSLLRHINENCKIKKSIDEEKENTFKKLLERDEQREKEINELKKQNKILMDKIDKLINMKCNSKQSKIINNNQKITNNTQNNNIMIVNFGKEDLKIIDEREFYDKIVKINKISGVKIPDEILKIIHFNPKYPQLSNIYISDINREKCMVYEDGQWKLSNIDNIPQIIDKICLFTKDQIDFLREKYPNNKSLNDRLNTIEKYNNKIDDEYIQDLREDDEYNNSKNIIKEAEKFQKYTYDTIKKTLYNEGKKIKKNIKLC